MKLKTDAATAATITTTATTATLVPAVLEYSFRIPIDVCIVVIGTGESSHINP